MLGWTETWEQEELAGVILGVTRSLRSASWGKRSQCGLSFALERQACLWSLEKRGLLSRDEDISGFRAVQG